MTLEEFTSQIESILERHKAQRVEDFDYVPDVKTITSKSITLEDWNTVVAAIENVITNNNTISDTTIALFELFKQYPDTVFPEFRKLLQEFVDELDINVDTSTLATKEELQNVIEIAEGKNSAYVIDSNAYAVEEWTYMDYKKFNGEEFTSYEDFLSYVQGAVFGNKALEVQDERVGWAYFDEELDIYAYRYFVLNNYKVLSLKDIDKLKTGDIFIVSKTEVPDRWLSIGYDYISTYFGKLETSKVDLSGVATKTEFASLSQMLTELSNQTIKEINTQYIRIWDLDVGIYKLTYDGQLKIYYGGATDTTKVHTISSTYSGKKLLFVFGETRNGDRKYAELRYEGTCVAFEARLNEGYIGNHYIYSPVETINGSSSVQKIYAPVDKGEAGQVLTSDGTNEPKFKNVFVSLSQEDYDALSTKDENVLYLIKE